MKKISILSAFVFCTLPVVMAQMNSKVVNSSTLVWAGLDFSRAKMIGSEGFTDPDAIAPGFFDKWNQLVIQEAKKYDIAKAYDKVEIIHDLSVVNEQNKAVDANELVINEPYQFNPGDVENIVKNYNRLKNDSGVGLLYIVEYFSKLDSRGSIYIVFFDLATQEILHQKQYITKPGGFGLRNYWANTVYETIKDSGKDYKKSSK